MAEDYRTEQLDIRGYRVPVQIGGAGEPLLLLHGAGGAGLWTPFHAALAKHFTVYAPAHPGFAGTPLPDWVKSVADLVFHYMDVLDTLGLKRITLAGISLGGWIATEFAATRPDLVARLILLAPIGVRTDTPMPDLFIKEPHEAMSYLFADPNIAAVLRAQAPNADMIAAMWSEQAAVARLIWKRPYNPQLERRLHHIKAPVLLLWGAEDRLVLAEHGRKLQGLIEGSRLVIIKGAGHVAPLEKPQELADAIIAFALSSDSAKAENA